MRCRLLVLLALLATASFVGVGSAIGQTCQYVHVLDECGAYLKVYPVGGTTMWKRIDLRDAGSNALSAVTFSTVPGFKHNVSFVAQSEYLRVVDHEQGVLRTIRVADASGIPGFKLQSVAAAPGFAPDDDPTTQYALYLVGNSGGVPWFAVFDQAAILSDVPLTEVGLGAGQLCLDGDCSGTAIDIAAGSDPAAGGAEQAYASVLAFDEMGRRRQRFFRIAREASSVGPWTVTLEPHNEGVVWNGQLHRHLGLAFDHLGERPTGVFQTERSTGDLVTGDRSCEIDGDPTDVAVWGPASGPEVDRLEIVTYEGPSGGELAILASDECPGPETPLSRIDPVPTVPIAVDISAPAQSEFWVYVASSQSRTVKALRYRIKDDGTGERIDLVGSVVLDDSDSCFSVGCAEHLAVGGIVPSGQDCPTGGHGECPGQTEPPLPCCLDEDDPDPRCVDCSGGGRRGLFGLP